MSVVVLLALQDGILLVTVIEIFLLNMNVQRLRCLLCERALVRKIVRSVQGGVAVASIE